MARKPQEKESASLAARGDGSVRLAVVADTHSAPHPRTMDRLAEIAPDAILHAGDIGDLAVLLEIARECGLAINLQQLATATSAKSLSGEAQAVSGVPYYVFNHRLALSGAQPPEILLKAINQSIDQLVPERIAH